MMQTACAYAKQITALHSANKVIALLSNLFSDLQCVSINWIL